MCACQSPHMWNWPTVCLCACVRVCVKLTCLCFPKRNSNKEDLCSRRILWILSFISLFLFANSAENLSSADRRRESNQLWFRLMTTEWLLLTHKLLQSHTHREGEVNFNVLFIVCPFSLIYKARGLTWTCFVGKRLLLLLLATVWKFKIGKVEPYERWQCHRGAD